MPRPIGVAPSQPPRLEGTIPLADGRRLGYAEFGDPRGRLVLWFHGTPGARRQVPPAARRAADELSLRIVCVERPGIGDSTDYLYPCLADWAADVGEVANRLGHQRFMVMGLSGGGPYALACAHELPERVVSVGLLGALVPCAGEGAIAEGLLTMTERFNWMFSAMRRPLGILVWGFMRAVNPLSHLLVQGFGRVMPDGDRRVLSDRELEAVFVDDLTVGSRRQFQGFVNDVVQIGRPWGFALSEIDVPVRWWHGDSDPFVPLAQAEKAAQAMRDCELVVRPGESHLGDFAASDEALRTMARAWHRKTTEPAARERRRGA